MIKCTESARGAELKVCISESLAICGAGWLVMKCCSFENAFPQNILPLVFSPVLCYERAEQQLVMSIKSGYFSLLDLQYVLSIGKKIDQSSFQYIRYRLFCGTVPVGRFLLQFSTVTTCGLCYISSRSNGLIKVSDQKHGGIPVIIDCVIYHHCRAL